jgi:transcriptional regulator with XRE-family HTH domain
MTATATRAGVGELMKEWRSRRRRSQLDLSLEVGVSTRHLSYVETGRSRPSPELVLAVAEHLEVPLRDRNTLLLAAGYAPRFHERPIDDPAMDGVRTALRTLLEAHDPYPGVVIDRVWDIVLANSAATALLAGIPAPVLEPRPNVFRICLHPDGLAARTSNFADWAAYLLRQIRRTIQLTGDGALVDLETEVRSYPNVADLSPSIEGDEGDIDLLVPLRLCTGVGTGEATELALFSTLTTFGTPRDITLDEVSVELFFPADRATELALRASAPRTPTSGDGL